MNESKLISLLIKFYELLASDDRTDADNSFLMYFQFDMSRCIIDEFGEEFAASISKMISGYLEHKSL